MPTFRSAGLAPCSKAVSKAIAFVCSCWFILGEEEDLAGPLKIWLCVPPLDPTRKALHLEVYQQPLQWHFTLDQLAQGRAAQGHTLQHPKSQWLHRRIHQVQVHVVHHLEEAQGRSAPHC